MWGGEGEGEGGEEGEGRGGVDNLTGAGVPSKDNHNKRITK